MFYVCRSNLKAYVILKIFVTIGCFFTSAFIFAQTYSISGRVVNASNEAVSYANVIITESGTETIVTGTTTDEGGQFALNAIAGGNYTLKISFIGFREAEQELELNKDIILPDIILVEEAETLSEVAITVRKPTLSRQPDRLVFNVQNTSLSEGNVMEVIRRTPGVLVLDDAITVKSSSPVIYINDRKVNLNSSDIIQLLQGTAASTIKSVEVITNPSARYDADSGTIINIVMMKNLITGYQGNVFANYTQGVFPKYNVGTSQFLKNRTTSFFLNYSYNDQKINRENREQVIYPDDTWNSFIDRNTRSETHTINFSFDVDFDDYNRLSISSNMLFLPYFNYRTQNRTEIDPATSGSFAGFNATNLSKDLKHNLGFNIDYEHLFKKNNSKLMFNAHSTLYDYRRNQEVRSTYFGVNDNPLFSNVFKTRADQNTSIYTGQIDYQLPIGQTFTFETGVKYSKVNTESAILQKNIVDFMEVVDPDNSDMFDYDEQVYAAYVNFSKKWAKWSFSAGLRAEQTEVKGVSASISEPNEQDYLEWFPVASLGFEASDAVSIYANYKRSIVRPNFRNLNPFKFFLNDNTIVTGNPGLQPVFIDHFTAGTSVGSHIFEVYYKEYKGNIFELPLQDNQENIVSYTPINFEITYELGFDYLVDFEVMEDWSVSFLSSFYYTKDQIGLFNGQNAEQDIWANYSELTNSLYLLKDKSLVVDLTLNYISENIQGLQRVDPRILSELSLKKTAFKGKGTFSLAVVDLFNDHDFLVTTRFLDQNSSNFSNLDNRLIRVGFRYAFGNTKLSSTEKSLSKEERERLD
ncbi:MAG: TonB-dependent receptor [Flavobacteriaceae bacterium]|nr:TonB-dependent receptor [Bacteroidia bacterium]MBT8286599.1 TonB-dependent receptor [Bacteroidia bacterium]NNF75124.1 TonB-dependent receptor [Flavobacteriaceae bacterium]